MKVCILEPHPDDALLNAGGCIIQNPHHQYNIITISQRHDKDSQTKQLEYYFPNIRVFSLDLCDLVDEFDVWSSWSSEDALKVFLRKNQITLKQLLAPIQKLSSQCHIILLPLGSLHPLHKAVSKLKLTIPSIYYDEIPYNSFEETRDFYTNLSLKRVFANISKAYEEKYALFKLLYPSQQFLLRFINQSSTAYYENFYGNSNGVTILKKVFRNIL